MSYKNNPSLLDKRTIGMGSGKKVLNFFIDKEVTKDNLTLLQMAERYFADMATFRTESKRVTDYVTGNQWGDYITDPTTKELITEEQHIINQGALPMKQNLMRNNMRNLNGTYQKNPVKSTILSNKKETSKVGEMLTNTLYYAHQINDGPYLMARIFDEFMISGLAVGKVLFQYRPELERPDILFKTVDTRRFIFNTDIADPRMYDMNFQCEIIDAPIEEIIMSFAKSKRHEQIIRDAYLHADTYNQYNLEGLSTDATDALDFYVPYESNKCRLFEIWYKDNVWGLNIHDPLDSSNDGYRFEVDGDTEILDLENTNRRLVGLANGILEEDIALIEYSEVPASIWKYKFLTPNGYCLMEGISPYEHGETPFAVLGYPMIRGKIWGPMADIIDQQRNINRYFTQMGLMHSASAKGVWLVPEESRPDDMTKQAYIDELARIGGVVFYKSDPRVNPAMKSPEQKFSQASHAGLSEMLSIQLQMFQDVSGIQPSTRGERPSAGTAASLYSQEVENASTNTSDFILAYAYFTKKLDTKITKTIIQFYKEKRLLHIAGKGSAIDSGEFDPELVDGFNFDLIVTPGNNSPTYRQIMDDMLYNLLQMQAISIEQFLENTSLPFADKLLESIRNAQQALQNGEPIPGVPQEVIDGITSQANPEAMALLNQSMR